MRQFCLALLLTGFSAVAAAHADCPPYQFFSPDQQAEHHIQIRQQRFAHAVNDLLVESIGLEEPKSSRLSFTQPSNDSQTDTQSQCDFPVVVALKGADWGWHIAWLSRLHSGVFYARLDSQAWVTSPAKRLFDGPVSQLRFEQQAQQIILHLQLTDGQPAPTMTLQSDDEGKDWQPPSR